MRNEKQKKIWIGQRYVKAFMQNTMYECCNSHGYQKKKWMEFNSI